MRKFFKRFWVIGLIFVIWFIFSSPYFLQGKVPYPSTYQVNNFAPWSAYEQFWGPVKNGAMPDVITQIYPWRHLTIGIWKSGQIPLWNPYSFGGTPLLANYQSAVLSPFNILFFIFPFIDAWSILVLVQSLLAGIFMYMFTQSLGRSRIPSLVACVSFMFCGFITVWMGYATLVFAILFLPLSLFCIEKFYQTEKFRFLFLLAVSIPFSFFSGHFQISLYFLISICIYIVYKLFSTRNIIAVLYSGFSVVLGVLMSMPQILPSIEFYTQSFRSTVFQKDEVIPWSYIPTFLAPDFFGNPVTRNDWFGHYAEWNAYIGVLPLMLAFYALSGKKRGQIFFLFVSSILVLLLAFPSPLQDFFVNLHIPVLSSSAVSRIIVLYSFLFAVLSSFGFDGLIKDINDRKIAKIIFWLSIFFLFFLILWLAIGLKIFIPEARISVAKSNLILPTLIFGISSIVIFIATMNKRLLVAVSFLILLVVSFDMLRFSIKWQAFDPRDFIFPNTPTTKAFSRISGYDRVLGNFGGEAAVYYSLSSVEGYDALYIKDYARFISYIQDGSARNLNRSVVIFSKDGIYTPKVINFLDVKYIVHKLADDRAGWTFPYWIYPKDQFKLVHKDKKYEFYENTKAFPRAFLVGKYKIIKEPQKVINTMFSNNFDLRKEIILEKDPKFAQTENLAGTAKITSYNQNKIEILTEAKSDSLLFLTDIYYSGWKAKVDGKEVPILKADYTFRAVVIGAGKHSVRFFYEPWSFMAGVYLGVVGLIGVLVMFLVSKTLNRLR